MRVLDVEYKDGDLSITYKRGASTIHVVNYKYTMEKLMKALQEHLTEFYDLSFTVTVSYVRNQADSLIEKIIALLRDSERLNIERPIDLVFLYEELVTMRSVVRRTAYLEKICQEKDNDV